MESEPFVHVTVCFSAGVRQVVEKQVQLPVGSCLADAIRASGVMIDLPDSAVDALQVGVWGRKSSADQPVREGDRIELYRELKVDPKVARRARFSKQGARTTGLFSKRRAGAKSGY